MIDIGGYRLHCIVSGVGHPTVVFESGLGEDHSTWDNVVPAIAALTSTFTYDRAGLGKSDPSPYSRDASQMVQELHMLLSLAKMVAPYILVGHSLGAWIVSLFAHRYPKEVAGLVLVDPAYQNSRLRAEMSEEQWSKREAAIAEFTGRMSESQQRERDALQLSGQQALQAFPIPDVPTVVLSGIRTNPDFPDSSLEKEVKLRVHQEWVAKVPRTEHVLVSASRHYIQNDDPSKVISAIQQVLGETRSGK